MALRRSLSTAVAAVSLLAAACAPVSAPPIDLTDSLWRVAAIDGETAHPQALVTVHFHDLDQATIESECFELELGLQVETDGQGFGFEGTMERATKDCDEATSYEAERELEALLGANAWSVIDLRTLELTGEHRVRLSQVY
jgi:hypothetical protein